jgi:phosphatidate cytidylyltransferase
VKRVLTAVILIPIVVLALFKAPLWLFTLLVLGVALLAAKEYFDIAEATGFRPFRKLSYLLLVCIFLVSFVGGKMLADVHQPQLSVSLNSASSIALLLVVFSPFLLLVAGMTRDNLSQALPDSASSFLALPYVGASLASMVVIRSASNGALFLLVLMILIWFGDIAAFYVGRAIGRHKLAPAISPGKSWEGAVASGVGVIVLSVVALRYLEAVYNLLNGIHLISGIGETVLNVGPTHLSRPVPIAVAIVFAVCINVSAQLGDLAESMLKRGGGVKDSGTLLPGHGGVLDRIDALLFAAPVGWLFYFTILGGYFRVATGG